MTRTLHRLNALKVARMTKPGRYADGGNLFLQVTPTGSKSWLLRYMRDGRAREMGIGPLGTIGLAEARERAREARVAILDELDPLELRRSTRAQVRLEAARVVTFRTAAEGYLDAHQAGWKNAKHAAQWAATLKAYAYPTIGDLPVAEINVGLVLKCVEPIWSTKAETASRVRGRIESVLDWATARGHRKGDNPARWKGGLEMLLPAPRKVARVKHHAAMSYAEMIPAFMGDLRKAEVSSARALEFLILTATRTNETLQARWSEIDFAAKTWTISADRMKAGRAHRVPLSPRALAILESLPREKGGYVFPGSRAGAPPSNMTLLMFLRRNGHEGLTVHGFRSTFRDWAAEATAFPAEAAEMALAHTVSDATEAAYRRGDLLAKWKQLMAAWAAYCASAPATGANVVPMNRSNRKTTAHAAP